MHIFFSIVLEKDPRLTLINLERVTYSPLNQSQKLILIRPGSHDQALNWGDGISLMVLCRHRRTQTKNDVGMLFQRKIPMSLSEER